MRLTATIAIVGVAGLVAGAGTGAILTLSADDSVLQSVRATIRIGLGVSNQSDASPETSTGSAQQSEHAEAVICRVLEPTPSDQVIQGHGGCLVRGPIVRLSANRIILDRAAGRAVATGSVGWLDGSGRLNKAEQVKLVGEAARIVTSVFANLAPQASSEPADGRGEPVARRPSADGLATGSRHRTDRARLTDPRDPMGPVVQTPVEGWRTALPVVQSPRVICGRIVQDGPTGRLIGSDGCVALAAGKGLRADELQLDLKNGTVTARGRAFQWDGNRQPVPIEAAPVMPPLSLAIRRYLLDADRRPEREAFLDDRPIGVSTARRHQVAGRQP